jgi:GH15 family glucan-1,4-alpha-glucosidase
MNVTAPVSPSKRAGRREGYRPLADYGLIGDMHSSALVCRDGSVDYCSMPHLDSPTIFAALLDDEKGGYYWIRPEGEYAVQQRYLDGTNILIAEFSVPGGRARLRDLMAVKSGQGEEERLHVLHRCVHAEAGCVPFVLDLVPRPSSASGECRIQRNGDLFTITSRRETFTFIVKCGRYEVQQEEAHLRLRFEVRARQDAHFDFIFGEKQQGDTEYCSFDSTHAFWKEWAGSCITGSCPDFGGYTSMITRSLLVLKLLTFEPTGAIAAAPTTSLPETIDGERNWDYRFSWLRDSSFTLRAMFATRHIDEAGAYIRWLRGTYRRYGAQRLQIMYSLRGDEDLAETVLAHLHGYRGSRPVRIGNAAASQRQWDVYGEVMDTALRLSDYHGRIDETLWPFFVQVCELAAANWQSPDEGIWEVKNGPFHFVYSKVMCWVALDRGIKIARRYGFEAPLARWEQVRRAIRSEVLEKGFNRRLNSFVQHYGTDEVDASLLLLCLFDFLPVRDGRIGGTIKACTALLMRDGYLLRYVAPDGLAGRDGAFILCNFWLVECLVRSGKIGEARELLATTTTAANSLGLFSEEYDVTKRELLGNFPQALSHIGYINAVAAILQAERRQKRSARRSLVSWTRKALPFGVVLNAPAPTAAAVRLDIAARLKTALDALQGAFFDVREGVVDYAAMRHSDSFNIYLSLVRELAGFDPFVSPTTVNGRPFGLISTISLSSMVWSFSMSAVLCGP